jgi:inhibitor of cysteine peptidase
MNKTRLLIMWLATLVLLGGCPWNNRVVNLNKSNNGDTVSLANGGRLVVTLDSNPTTGYSWGLAELDDSVLTEVNNTFTLSPGCLPFMVGCGGYETWRFDAVAPGTTTLRLEYRQWDTAQDAEDVFEIVVDVSG